MNRESTFSVFTGTVAALIGTAMTGVTLLYIWQTFWEKQVLDFNLKFADVVVPPESYAILLLVIWSVSQRAKAHMRPKEGGAGSFWRIEDRVEAIAAAIAIGVTVVYAFATKSNLSFAFVLVAYIIQAVSDVIFNGRHRYENGAVGSAAASDETSGNSSRDGVSVGSDGLMNMPTRLDVREIVLRLGFGSRNRTIEHGLSPAIDHRPADAPAGDTASEHATSS